jgi:hypothetical protein
MGSPALASYSLQITHLNNYWFTEAFVDVDYPNSNHMATILAAFHHIPVQVEYSAPFLHSLIVLPENDQFWLKLAAANKSRRWSVPLVMSYVLAIFSLLLTIADSISSHPGSTGYAIAAIWTFLLPLIIGWLYIGCEPEPSHLRKSLAAANENVWVATEQRGQPVNVTRKMAIEFAKPRGADAELVNMHVEAANVRAGASGVDLARGDELKPVPVFNYSRAFVTPMIAEVVLRLIRNAAANKRQEIPVRTSVSTTDVPVWVPSERAKTSPQNRVGTVAEVVNYCTTVLQPPKRNSDLITPSEIQTPEPETVIATYPPLLDHGLLTPSRWAPGIWTRVAIASALALGLQWGTAGAAMYIHYIAPPVGLGCRAFSFLLYGVAGTFSFFLFLTSSILAHMSRPLPGQDPTCLLSRTSLETGAIICRLLGKCVAIASALGIILVCFFQVTEAFNNCYCTSTTFDRGRGFVVFTGVNFVPDSKLIWLWIGGLAIAFVTAILFGGSMYAGLPTRR